jgi:putative nucleotidyltransferase with HDIG domain
VTVFTICIARAMGLSREHINPIAHGAVFHDVGKMAIPDRILRKPGPPDAGRNAIMRQHCIRGYELVHKIPFLADAAEIVYSHHERYDGAGYPRGLASRQIPLEARIVSVANCSQYPRFDHL